MSKAILAVAIICLTFGSILAGCVGTNTKTNSAERLWDSSYGNSNFGYWKTDEFGLPAFEYTCDQQNDARAWYSPALKNRNSHWHQVGNDKIIAIGTNDGYVQLYNCDRGPKWTNYYNTSQNEYAGGFGYVNDGTEAWSTMYLDRPAESTYERVFGMGYYEKKIDYRDISVDQFVAAPFGDDAILISRVEISNNGNEAKEISYFEYWDINILELTYLASTVSQVDLREMISNRFTYETSFDPELNAVVGKPNGLADNIAQPPTPFIGDIYPPEIFLACFGEKADGFDGSTAFFGSGTKAMPDAVKNGKASGSAASENPLSSPNTALLTIQNKITLLPGESKTLHYGYGYADSGMSGALIEKYARCFETALEDSMNAWKDTMPKFSFPQDRWMEREMAWDYYYLRSGASYDEFFNEHIISQGWAYQYDSGFNAAARDQLQHALPTVFLDPELARDTIRYTMKTALPVAGEIPYSIAFYGMFSTLMWIPSDADLYLMLLASEYVLNTRDMAFLDEVIPYYPLQSNTGAPKLEDTIYEHLKTAYNHLIYVVGIGEHGLIKMRHGDWNDGIVLQAGEKIPTTIVLGESTLNTAIATYAFPMLAQVAEMKGDDQFARTVWKQNEALKAALQDQWREKWFNRAWLGEGTEVGADKIYLEPQPWAMFSPGVMTDGQAETLIGNIYPILDSKSPIGAAQVDEPTGSKPGECADGGIWYALNGPLVWATSLYDPQLAWTEMRNITFAKHSEVYPDLWCGVWSGPDSYNSWRSDEAGWTWWIFSEGDLGDKWPIQNMHSHAWPLYACYKMAGITADNEGFTIDPNYPFEEFSVDYGIIGLKCSADSASGHYTSLSDGNINMRVKIPSGLVGKEISASVDGNAVECSVDGGFATFRMKISKETKTEWDLFSE